MLCWLTNLQRLYNLTASFFSLPGSILLHPPYPWDRHPPPAQFTPQTRPPSSSVPYSFNTKQHRTNLAGAGGGAGGRPATFSGKTPQGRDPCHVSLTDPPWPANDKRASEGGACLSLSWLAAGWNSGEWNAFPRSRTLTHQREKRSGELDVVWGCGGPPGLLPLRPVWTHTNTALFKPLLINENIILVEWSLFHIAVARTRDPLSRRGFWVTIHIDLFCHSVINFQGHYFIQNKNKV